MKSLLFFCCLVLVLAPAFSWSEGGPKKNVLFLICDDLNCDIGCYGDSRVKTPNIDRLAARGVRFDRAYCQYPLCGPSRASFMTGLYPDQTGMHGNGIYLRETAPGAKTMTQLFRDHGYFAIRIGKIFHYNVPMHIGTGGHDDPDSWNQTFNPRGRDKDDEPLIFSLTPGQFGGTLSWLAAEGRDEEQTDALAAEEAARQLKRCRDEKRPFFLAVGLYRPHTPYVAPKKYFDLYPRETITVPKVPEGYDATLPVPALNTIRRKKDQINLAEDLAKQAIQAYLASITFADAQVGKILDALDETGLAANTVVTFTSDHGYHMGQHGHWQKTTLFEDATRVPFIIADPEQKEKGAVSACLAEMIDFYPTLAARCGLPAPKHLAGIDLSPVLEDVSARPRQTALSQYESGYSLRRGNYRYTAWGENGAGGNELYDHQSDPDEMKNLASDPSRAELVAELKKELEARIAAQKNPPEGIRRVEQKKKR